MRRVPIPQLSIVISSVKVELLTAAHSLRSSSAPGTMTRGWLKSFTRRMEAPGPVFSAVVLVGALLPSLAAAQGSASRCSLSDTRLKAERVAVGTGFVAGNAELWRYFKRAWWSGEKAKHLFFRADWDQEFRDQDKFGHLYGGYHLTRVGHAALRSVCVSERKAVIASAAYAAFFQLQIEVFDGMYKKYGFSYADMIANTAGQTFAVLQELHPRLKAIKPTMSYSPSRAMRNRSNFTAPSELRRSLDYSGQTYWMSVEPKEFLPSSSKRYWPNVLRLSVGHSVTDWVDPETGASQRAKRRLLLTLDLNPQALPGNGRLMNFIKHELSYYHFPAPALQITPHLRGLQWYR